ncbi:hypothetical protein POM88_037795 [Heracleum sosnowskyi]|uniref:Uncharacterized protein n=1 Tax=Heracleum sosnowskyi TaxID=360622 RepID=A0AAD8MH21_9APIA|nr:hypothetical protein POM88_037795 [Heracleum sosnowskyi]
MADKYLEKGMNKSNINQLGSSNMGSSLLGSSNSCGHKLEGKSADLLSACALLKNLPVNFLRLVQQLKHGGTVAGGKVLFLLESPSVATTIVTMFSYLVKFSLEAAKLARVSSREARILAEDAFFHPSMMSVSYYSFGLNC